MTEQEARDRIFLAVDFTDLSQAPHLLQIAAGVHGLKIDRHQKVSLNGIESMARMQGVKKVYFDTKSSDGPDQMPLTIDKAARQGADYLSLSISAGAAALRAAVAANHNRLNLIGVTIPSDMPEEDCLETFGHSVRDQVPRMASIAVRAGLKQITCSAHEVAYVKSYRATRGLSVIATGIRMPGEDHHDQVRVATASEAIANGADAVAIGRSITAHDDPERALALTIEDMKLASVA